MFPNHQTKWKMKLKEIKWWRSMRIDSRGRRGTNPVYSPSRTLHHSAPPLLAPRCAAKLSRLRRESSLRRPAPSSLVVAGGGRDEKWAGRRTGQVRALFHFNDTSFQVLWLSHDFSLPKDLQRPKKIINYTGSLDPGTLKNKFSWSKSKWNTWLNCLLPRACLDTQW